MPKREHAKIAKAADKLGLRGKKRDAYIYKTLNLIKERRKRKRK